MEGFSSLLAEEENFTGVSVFFRGSSNFNVFNIRRDFRRFDGESLVEDDNVSKTLSGLMVGGGGGGGFTPSSFSIKESDLVTGGGGGLHLIILIEAFKLSSKIFSTFVL